MLLTLLCELPLMLLLVHNRQQMQRLPKMQPMHWPLQMPLLLKLLVLLRKLRRLLPSKLLLMLSPKLFKTLLMPLLPKL